MYTLGAFQTAPSVLGLWLSDIACWPFKSRDSVSYGPFVLLELSHTDFQSRISWELLFPLQVPRANPTQAWSPCFSGCASIPVVYLLLVGCYSAGGLFPYLASFLPVFLSGVFLFMPLAVKDLPCPSQLVFLVSCITCSCCLCGSLRARALPTLPTATLLSEFCYFWCYYEWNLFFIVWSFVVYRNKIDFYMLILCPLLLLTFMSSYSHFVCGFIKIFFFFFFTNRITLYTIKEFYFFLYNLAFFFLFIDWLYCLEQPFESRIRV